MKKPEQNVITKQIKKNWKKDHVSVIEIFLKIRILNKEIMVILKTKNMSYGDGERKEEHMKSYYNKRKNLLNHLINRVEELQKVSLNGFLIIIKVFLGS